MKACTISLRSAGCEARLAQAKFRRPARKGTRIFLAIEALFRRGGNYAAVHDQSRARIMALRDAVFPLVQAGPFLALETERVSQPTDTENCSYSANRAPLSVASRTGWPFLAGTAEAR